MMSVEYFDDGDGPTSHRHLYEMDREDLFTLFVGAVADLKVDDEGAHCWSAEAQALSRMARAVQARTDSNVPREGELCGLATVTRVLLSSTDNHDRGADAEWHMPLSELAARFVRLRNEIGDFIPAASPSAVPDDLSAMDEPADEELALDDPLVRELAERDPEIAKFIAAERRGYSDEDGYRWFDDGRPPERIN